MHLHYASLKNQHLSQLSPRSFIFGKSIFGSIYFCTCLSKFIKSVLTTKVKATIIFIYILFDVLPNVPFTASETMRDYLLYTWYIPVASRVAERPRT